MTPTLESKNSHVLLTLIEHMDTGSKALLAPNIPMPAGYTIPRRRHPLTAYGPDGSLKKLYRNLPVYDGSTMPIAPQQKQRRADMVSVISDPKLYIVIQDLNTQEYYLWSKQQPIPLGLVKVLKYKSKPCYFEGELSAACLKLPIYIVPLTHGTL